MRLESPIRSTLRVFNAHICSSRLSDSMIFWSVTRARRTAAPLGGGAGGIPTPRWAAARRRPIQHFSLPPVISQEASRHPLLKPAVHEPSLGASQVGKKLGEAWKKLSDAEKAKYAK